MPAALGQGSLAEVAVIVAVVAVMLPVVAAAVGVASVLLLTMKPETNKNSHVIKM